MSKLFFFLGCLIFFFLPSIMTFNINLYYFILTTVHSFSLLNNVPFLATLKAISHLPLKPHLPVESELSSSCSLETNLL